MNINRYSVNNKNYINSVFTGFSHLQKTEEFVDLTLAADGASCKVHRNLVALASPYLRDILKNLPGNNSVIFLNNVKKEILQYIIEYIYQGDVKVPVELIREFKEVCKSLYIAGFDGSHLTKQSHEPLESISKKAKKRKLNEKSISIEEDIVQFFDDNNGYKSDHYINTQEQNNTLDTLTNNYLQCNNNEQESLDRLNNHNDEDLMTYQNNELQNSNSLAYENPPLPTENTITIDHAHTSEHGQYKIVVKPSQDQAGFNNIPVIEICPQIDAPNDILNDNEFDFLNLITIPEKSLQNIQLLSQTETNSGSLTQNKPSIKILSNNVIKGVGTSIGHSAVDQTQVQTTIDISQNYSNITDPVININQDNAAKSVDNLNLKANIEDFKNMAQFSITERGALQLILNRCIYNCHGRSIKKQIWRCTDYRRKACPASVNTRPDGSIIRRKGLHCHMFHDSKIFKKHKANLIFDTINLAEQARDSKQKEGLTKASIEEIDLDNLISDPD